MVFYRGQWIAVGVHTAASVDGGTGEEARIWISKDRRHWEAVADPQSFSGDIYITSVAVGPTGIVAVGRQDSRAQAWFSADGRSWRAAPLQESLGDGMAMAVEHGPTGYVAVGYTFALGVGVSAAVWRSTDGLEWHLMPAAEGFESTSLMSIAFSHGLEVVVGGTTHVDTSDAAGPTVPSAWSSRDGLNWSHAQLPFEDSADVLGVVANANGFLAVGNGAGPQVWVSDAGDAWRLLEADAYPGAGRTAGLTGVASSGNGLVATGYDSDGESGWGTIWVSDNGLTWRSVAGKELFLGVGLHAVVIEPNGLVAVGQADDPARDYVAAAWYSR